MPPRSGEFDEEMNRLEAAIKRLEAEYTMFFSGRLPRLPWETRAKVEQLVKHYDRMNLRNTAERFRFSVIQTRFTKFSEVWERQLKAREEGRMPAGRPSSFESGSAPAPALEPARPPALERTGTRHAAPAPFKAEAIIRDPGRDADQVRELYERLSRARQETGEAPLPYTRFEAVIKAQVAKHGGSAVAFRVTVNDGKVTLSTKPTD